jgi:hypothetical protein
VWPTGEEFLVAAPADARAKDGPGFKQKWDRISLPLLV